MTRTFSNEKDEISASENRGKFHIWYNGKIIHETKNQKTHEKRLAFLINFHKLTEND